MEFIEWPALSERLWPKFDGLAALPARLCWLEGAYRGVRLEPLHRSVFERLI